MPQGGPAGDDRGPVLHLLSDRLRERLLLRGAENQHVRVQRADQAVRQVGKAVGQPTLGGAEGRSRMKPHQEPRPVEAERFHALSSPRHLCFVENQPNVLDRVRPFNQARPEQELHVVVRVVPVCGCRRSLNRVRQ